MDRFFAFSENMIYMSNKRVASWGLVAEFPLALSSWITRLAFWSNRPAVWLQMYVESLADLSHFCSVSCAMGRVAGAFGVLENLRFSWFILTVSKLWF